jgi:hypothetical protein
MLSLMSSFSCLKEYFFPELSSFGRLTGLTEMIGRAFGSGQISYFSGPDLKTTRKIRSVQ